jgi:hypothetical protein
MFTAKDIEVRVIDAESSRKIVSRYHYSGKCTQNSQLHFGVFLDSRLEGALQFGPSIDKRRMAQNLGVGFNETLELNRMALSDRCPKNSESRALGVCLRIIKKRYPHIRVVVSFADACQCGDGTIYRAAGFRLHSIKKNTELLRMPDGGVVAKKSLNNHISRDGRRMSALAVENGARPLHGYQVKYLYFFDKELERCFKLVKFDSIPDGVKMYKGIRRVEHEDNASTFRVEEGGLTPTSALHSAGLGISAGKQFNDEAPGFGAISVVDE